MFFVKKYGKLWYNNNYCLFIELFQVIMGYDIINK